jgi:TIR domain
MPPQDRVRRDKEARPAPARKRAAQQRQQCTVGGAELGPRDLAVRHLELVAEHRDLDVLGVLASQAPKQHANEPARHEVEEGQSHRRIIAWPDPHCSAHPAEFLNPTSPDKTLVTKVNSALRRRHRLNTWIDQAEMYPSNSLTPSVKSGLGQASHIILFWSAASARSGWVKRELELATRGQNQGKPVIIVRLDAEPLPMRLRDHLYIDATGTDPDQIANYLADAIDKLDKRSRRRFPRRRS